MTGDWYRNNRRITSVPVDDRGFQYGDGLFETVAIRAGSARLWQLHVDRLAGGCERIGFRMPSESSLHEAVGIAVKSSLPRPRDGVIKLMLTAPPSDRGYSRPRSIDPDVTIGAFPARLPERDAYRTGVDTILCSTELASPSVTAGLKTLNRLEQVIAAAECRAANVFDGLTCDAVGRVICGTMSNVFFVSGQAIITPSVARCGVAGVMRRFVMESLAGEGIEVAVGDFLATELGGADEVFITNSQFGILPVRRCGELQWTRHERTFDVMTVVGALGIGECCL